MIRIYVNGQQLAMKHDTILTVELNNALFASPDIEGDISFSFTLPVEGNEIALEFAHLPQTGKLKKLPCQVYCSPGFNWSGQLVLQKSDRENITAALVINPYPEGFGKAKLTELHDEDVVISQSRESHNQAWEDFLVASIGNQDVKLAPFFNEDGYGNENEDYGRWHGVSRKKIVNAIFFNQDGTLIDATGSLFSKAHNERFELYDGDDSVHIEMNQLAFCPQIRIARILETWCRNAGYKFTNHLGEDFNKTYLQSMKSLDGTMAQYETPLTTIWASAEMQEAHVPYYLESDDHEHVQGGKLILNQTGWWKFIVNAQIRYLGEIADARFIVFDSNHSPSQAAAGDGVVADCLTILEQTGHGRYAVSSTYNIYISQAFAGIPLQMAFFHGNNILFQGSNDHSHGEVPTGLNLAVLGVGTETNQLGFNIFRSKFRIPELLPNIANSAFLKTMLETMGLCYFVSAKTKSIEMVPYAMLKKAKCLDLSDYELTRETETSEPEETLRTFRLKPLKNEEYNEDLRLEDVDDKLPDAYSHHEHLVLRAKTNTLYRAERQEAESEESWEEGWEEYSGNPDRLEIGEGDEENREPSVLIPHQRLFSMSRRRPDTDTQSGQTPQLMVADFAVSSDLYNTAEKPSDIILTQYRGFRQRSWEASTDHPSLCNEVMLPVWNDEFSLTAKGRNSLGEKYVKPVLELLGHKNVTYKFRLPANMIQAVEDTLRPSVLPPEMQTRYIIVRNVKSVPKKITIQIDNDIDDTVLCQIEAVKAY